ncbi:MAG TPA: hypothetical protein VMS17_19025 [Gemmataceae bacterium]|nr:hypothetical protein [Gemmataceae bacterium]
MRLTLRTLLAYLDDTLEPNEIKEMGQKVAESDAAQELVARIKQVMRRRRLTTPPAGGPNSKFDANSIAEYLDNELSSELVSELEKTCLESDVHLAEVASCHQILTLVLGEPALVPPTARERMYGLVKGPEAMPFRKARLRDGNGEGEGERDHDDFLLAGLPASRGWLLWALPLAAVLVLAALAFAIWQALPPAPAPAVAAVTPPSTPVAGPPDGNKPAPVVPAPEQPHDKPMTDAPMNPPPMNPPMNPPDMNPPMNPPAAGQQDERPQPPSKVRAVVGAYLPPQRGESSILIQRQADQPGWKRLPPTGRTDVFSVDDLVSLPGYNSELALGADHGVHLLLHGHVPQFAVRSAVDYLRERADALPGYPPAPGINMDYLMESAVQLHQPPPGFDADVTLDRGRIYLSSRRPADKEPAKVRLRFGDEVWDLTLTNNDRGEAEVGVDLIQTYDGDVNYNDEPPLRALDLVVLSGAVGFKMANTDNRPATVLAPRGFVLWNNKSGVAIGPQPVLQPDWPAVQLVWSKAPPVGASQEERDAIAQMREALDNLSMLMTDKKTVEDALLEARPEKAAEKPMLRTLAIYCYGATDDVERALDVLCTDESDAHSPDRSAAVVTLRQWVGRDKANGARLYNESKGSGELKDSRHFSLADAKNIFVLLHSFAASAFRQQATFDLLTSLLQNKQLAIRELAYWHLLKLSAGARVALPAYNAAWVGEKLDRAVGDWKDLVKRGELPPPLPTAPPKP